MWRRSRTPARVAPEPPWVLIADDEQDVVATVVMIVASISGMTVRTCNTGTQALWLVEQHGPPTLAILDVLLAGRHGIDVARHIRIMPRGDLCQVLFLSSIDDEPIRPLVRDVAPFAFHRKPVARELLREVVQEALERWSSVA